MEHIPLPAFREERGDNDDDDDEDAPPYGQNPARAVRR
jgi:hypothetical protein